MNWKELSPLVALLLYTFIIIWVYVNISLSEKRLQFAARNQRICGNQAFESETVRWAVWNMSNSSFGTFKIVLLVIGLLAMIACILAIAAAAVNIDPKALDKHKISQILIYAIVFVLIIAMMSVVYDIYGWKKNSFLAASLKGYKQDMKAMVDVFTTMKSTIDLGGDKGKWLSYREVLAKRIAKQHNLNSHLEAEDMLDVQLEEASRLSQRSLSEPPEILACVQFDQQRDFTDIAGIIQKYTNDLSAAKSALENLKFTDKYNPYFVYERRFKRIQDVIMVATFVAAFAWLRVLASNKVVGIIGIMFFIVFMTGLYMSL